MGDTFATAATIAAEGAERRGRIVPARMAHFVIRSKNVPVLVKWYKTVFEADAVFDNGSLAFLYFDDEHHRIAIGDFPDIEDSNSKQIGIDHVAFSYDDIRDLLVTYKRLKGEGIAPFFTVDHGPTTSFYYRDPEKNQVELQVDNFATRDEAHAYFQSDAFRDNPIGIEVDADILLADLEKGADPQSLLSFGTRPVA